MDFSNLTIIAPPVIDSRWSRKDYLGALRVRFSMGRNRYRVTPGLYKLGQPGSESEVFVTSNYKLSFDVLRRNLNGINAWILILETYGINVWCAAGKGTFGTDELIRQVKETHLAQYIEHKRLILPQLGAPGVSAHKVKEATGLSVKFGPVRADDIKEYISMGFKKNEVTRSVQFNIRDRFILAPVELVNSLRYFFIALIIIVLMSGLNSEGYSVRFMWPDGLRTGLYLLAAYISGAFLAPVLLPWLPFRYFSGKGLVMGFLTFGTIVLFSFAEQPILGLTGWMLISGAVSSFLTMNFTGASTYTSLSGVRKEMRIFVPLQISFALIGLTLFMISKFV